MSDRRPWITLLLFLAVDVLLWWQPLVSVFKLALSNDAYTYLLLIAPLSLTLLYVKIKELSSDRHFPPIFAMDNGPIDNKKIVALVALTALLRFVTARNVGGFIASDQLSLSVLALVICWIGAVVVCFGVRNLRILLFPVCLLFLLVPFPERLLNPITSFLQYESARGASILFHVARVPVTREGVMLFIPGLDIEVATECSSIRSSMMLIVVTLVLAYLFLDSYWKRTLLVLIAIPLSVAKNSLRIFTIAELATRVDRSFLTGRLHRQGGVVFLSIALMVVVALIWILRKGELRQSRAS